MNFKIIRSKPKQNTYAQLILPLFITRKIGLRLASLALLVIMIFHIPRFANQNDGITHHDTSITSLDYKDTLLLINLTNQDTLLD